MNRTRDERIEDLFADCLERPRGERTAWLTAAANGDAGLVDEVRSLLEAYDRAPGLFDPAVLPLGPEAVDEASVDGERTLGSWRIVRLLATGGMGAVYLGERIDDSFRMQVAIKVLAARMLHPGLLAQFRVERQILADLDHPGIARLLDGGTTAEGTPYLVMEFVDGEPITEAADRAGLDVEERLRLFLSIADAVQYAHANLVVHRDLKPGNIVLRKDGQPKLLDFGIARVFAPPGASDAPETQHGTALALTPRYASPEQLRGGRLTTATDIYSLGVVLYELLTGTFPHDVAGRSILDYGRAIEESAPVPPSHRRSGGGARRLRGDLDTIVLKALAREPARRYASVADFADDIRRHLAGEPVLARGDSAGYRIGQFVRANRGLVAGVAAVILALAAAFLVTLSFYQRATRSADNARWYAYTSTLAATEAAIMNHNMREARELLASLGPPATWEHAHLAGRLDRSRRRWPAHAAGVTQVRFSADGRRLLTTSVDGTARLWGVGTAESPEPGRAAAPWESLATWPMHVEVESGAFVDGGVVLGLTNGRIVLVSIGESRAEPLGTGRSWAILDADPAGRVVAAGFDDGTVAMYDVAARREVRRWVAHNRLPVPSFSPDGTRLATGGADNLVHVWNVADGRLLATFRGHHHRIFSLAWSPDGGRIVSGSRDHTATVWNAATGQAIASFTEHRGTIGGLAFHPNGRAVLSSGSEGRVMVWDATTGARTADLHGPESDVSAVAIAPDGSMSVTGEWDGTLRVWPWGVDDVPIIVPTTSALLMRLSAVEIDPTGRRAGVVGANGFRYMLLDGSGFELLERTGLRSGAWIDSTHVVVGDGDGLIHPLGFVGPDPERLSGHVGAVNALAVAPEGRLLASGGEDGMIRTWHLPGYAPRDEWSTGGGIVHDLQFDPPARYLASANADGRIRLWDAATAALADSLVADGSAVLRLAWAPDGGHLAATTGSGAALLWDLDRPAKPDTLLSPGQSATAITFSPDGRRVAIGSNDQLVYIADTARHSVILRLHGHIARVSGVRFTPDGRTLISCSLDGTVRAWKAE